MKFPELEALTADLEHGLGEFDAETIGGHIISSHPEHLRLTLEGVCGLADIAIAEHLRRDGHDVRMLLSKSAFSSDHTLLEVRGERETTIIDAGFCWPLVYAGITPGYAQRIDKEWVYPKQKIAVFPAGGDGPTAALLASTSVFIMRTIEPIGHRPEFQGIGGAGIYSAIRSIYDPQNHTEFVPTDFVRKKGLELAKFIDHAHAKLLD